MTREEIMEAVGKAWDVVHAEAAKGQTIVALAAITNDGLMGNTVVLDQDGDAMLVAGLEGIGEAVHKTILGDRARVRCVTVPAEAQVGSTRGLVDQLRELQGRFAKTKARRGMGSTRG